MTKAQGQKRRAHGMVPLAGPQSAQMHAGIGSATKPAYEPIVCARKPLSEKNLVQNILKYGEWLEGGTIYKVGTGGLNIDQSRIHSGPSSGGNSSGESALGQGSGWNAHNNRTTEIDRSMSQGRFPANLLLSHSEGCQRVGSRRVKGIGGGEFAKRESTENWRFDNHARKGYADPDGLEEVAAWECVEGCPVALIDEQSGNVKGAVSNGKKRGSGYHQNFGEQGQVPSYSDQGGASRFFKTFSSSAEPGFFYSPKASRAERNRGLEAMPETTVDDGRNKSIDNPFLLGETKRSNTHPTVKPTKLLSYLIRLVTPPGGTVLDCFAGSFSTGVAAIQEGFNFIGIEQDSEYCEIGERRLAHALREREEEFSGRLPF